MFCQQRRRHLWNSVPRHCRRVMGALRRRVAPREQLDSCRQNRSRMVARRDARCHQGTQHSKPSCSDQSAPARYRQARSVNGCVCVCRNRDFNCNSCVVLTPDCRMQFDLHNSITCGILQVAIYTCALCGSKLTDLACGPS